MRRSLRSTFVKLGIFAVVMVRKSLPDIVKLHPTHYGMLALGTVLFMATYLVQAFGWHLLLRALGQPVSIVDSARMFFMSMVARWMPGRVLYAATRLYIGRQVGISVTAVAFAIVLELIYILLGGVIVIVAFAGGIFQGVFSSPKGMLTLIGMVAIIIVAGMLAIKPSTLISLSRIPLFRRVMKKIFDSVDEFEKLVAGNEIFEVRCRGVGVIPPAVGAEYGVSGSNLRASGVDWDLRRDGLHYLV